MRVMRDARGARGNAAPARRPPRTAKRGRNCMPSSGQCIGAAVVSSGSRRSCAERTRSDSPSGRRLRAVAAPLSAACCCTARP